jgi:hypothetical protein
MLLLYVAVKHMTGDQMIAKSLRVEFCCADVADAIDLD